MVRKSVGISRLWLVSGTALWAAGMTMSSALAQETKRTLPVQERTVSILEKMQDEIASIAAQARPCIVTIEDARAVAVSYDNSALRKTDLKEQIAHLEIDKKAADALVSTMLQQYTAGTIPATELQKPKREQALINSRLAALQRRLAGVGQVDALTEQKQVLDARIAELEIYQKFYADQYKMTQEQVNAGILPVDGLNEVKRQQAHTEQDLTVLRNQRKELDKAKMLRNANIFRNTNNVIFVDGSGWGNTQQANSTAFVSNVPKSGSGFSIGDGYIVTTADVVQGMTNPIVTTDDGRKVRATLIAIDSELNIGLLRIISRAPIPALKLGDSATVVPGHFAISIGNQSGQVNSVALSMVSGIRGQGLTSSTHFYPNLLQIDGTIGAGTSGAPVLNVRGEVIGMVAAALNSDQTANTFDSANRIQLGTPFIQYNGTSVPFQNNLKLDYQLQPTQPGSQNNKIPQLKSSPDGFQGQRIQPAVPNSRGNEAPTLQLPAQRRAPSNSTSRGSVLSPAPQNKSDAITVVPGPNMIMTPTPSVAQSLADAFHPQEPVAQSMRGGSSSSNTGFAIPVNEFKSIIEELKLGKNIVHAWLGFNLEDIDNAREENGTVRLGRQVRIHDLYADAPASKAGGIQAGDIIIRLNDRQVHTANEVRTATLVGMKPGQKVEIELQRNGQTKVVALNAEARPAVIPPLLPPAVPAPDTRSQRR